MCIKKSHLFFSFHKNYSVLTPTAKAERTVSYIISLVLVTPRISSSIDSTLFFSSISTYETNNEGISAHKDIFLKVL